MSLVKDLGLEKSHLKSDFLEGNHVLLSCCHPGRAQPPTEILTPPWACEVVTPEVQGNTNILISVVCVSSGAIL